MSESQRRRTWRDWAPDDPTAPLLSRDQLIAGLHDTSAGEQPIRITVNQLRHLERVGVLPHPTRQWHGDAVRAVYPEWALPVIQTVRALQVQGCHLDEIRAWVFSSLSVIKHGNNPSLSKPEPHPHSLPIVVRRELRRLAQRRERLTGVATKAIEVRITSAEGSVGIYSLDGLDR